MRVMVSDIANTATSFPRLDAALRPWATVQVRGADAVYAHTFLDDAEAFLASKTAVDQLLRLERGDTVLYTDACGHDVRSIPDGVSIVGLLHGGSYEPHDPLYGNERLAELEDALFDRADEVYVNCEWHRDIILAAHPKAKRCLRVARFPSADLSIMPRFVRQSERSRAAVFAGRTTYDKGYDLIADSFVNVLRLDPANTSTAYYERSLETAWLLASPARKETYGIACIEALQRGTLPIMPRTACYPEIFGADDFYTFGPKLGAVEVQGFLRNRFEIAMRMPYAAYCRLVLACYGHVQRWAERIDSTVERRLGL